MGQLSSYIKQLREDFTNHYIGSPAHQSQHQLRNYQDQGAPPTGKNLPEVVNNIAWARQLEAKVLLQCVFFPTIIYMYSMVVGFRDSIDCRESPWGLNRLQAVPERSDGT